MSILMFLRQALKTASRLSLFILVLIATLKLFSILSSGQPTLPSSDIMSQKYETAKKAILADRRMYDTAEGRLKLAVFRNTLCFALGEECDESSGQNAKQGGAVGFMSQLIAAPYQHRPASGVYAVYEALHENHFMPKAYAAEGIGFSALKPFSAIWRVFRDISYLLLVLVIIIIGFMIMFRMNIDPQTVISVENALPRIVVTLLFITFSFAIAGFMIDLMYLMIALSISLLAKADPSLDVIVLQNQYFTANFGTIWNSMFVIKEGNMPIPGFTDLFTYGDAIANVLPAIIDKTVRVVLGIPFAVFFGTGLLNRIGLHGAAGMLDNIDILGNSIGNLPGGGIKLFLGFITVLLLVLLAVLKGTGVIFGILIFLTIFLLTFRIFFMLIFAYTRMLLLIIFSPIILMFGAFPGRNPFGFWIKGLFGELLTFPLVIVFLIVGRIIITVFSSQPASTQIWHPPFMSGFDGESFAVLVGLGLLFSIPNLIKLIKKAMGAEGMPLNVGLGTFFGGPASIAGGAMGIVGQMGSMFYAMQMYNTLTGKGGVGHDGSAQSTGPSYASRLKGFISKKEK